MRSRPRTTSRPFRFVVKHVATQFGSARVVSLPKPIFRAERERHAYPSVRCSKERTTRSGIQKPSGSCRRTALHYNIGGILRHARGNVLRITNPLRELLQTVGAGVRSAGERRVVPCVIDRRLIRVPDRRRAGHAASSFGRPDPAGGIRTSPLAVMPRRRPRGDRNEGPTIAKHRQREHLGNEPSARNDGCAIDDPPPRPQ